MSRSSYSDDFGDDYPGQLELFRANVRRSIRSKKGQARLTELRDALAAMPVKALYEDVFVSGDRVCALGAWAVAKGIPTIVADTADDEDIATALEAAGWPKLVVLDAVYFNDDAWRSISPEGRHARVLEWVEKCLLPTAEATPARERP